MSFLFKKHKVGSPPQYISGYLKRKTHRTMPVYCDIYQTGSLDQYQNENHSRHVRRDKESERVNECLSTSAAMLHII